MRGLTALLFHDWSHQISVSPDSFLVLEGTQYEEGVVPEVMMHGGHTRGVKSVPHALWRPKILLKLLCFSFFQELKKL